MVIYLQKLVIKKETVDLEIKNIILLNVKI